LSPVCESRVESGLEIGSQKSRKSAVNKSTEAEAIGTDTD
jgi:hypothetical protein